MSLKSNNLSHLWRCYLPLFFSVFVSQINNDRETCRSKGVLCWSTKISKVAIFRYWVFSNSPKHGEWCSLLSLSWWGPSWIWENWTPFHYTPRVPKYFLLIVWTKLTVSWKKNYQIKCYQNVGIKLAVTLKWYFRQDFFIAWLFYSPNQTTMRGN